ncbi:phosphotransferase [Actinophytocola oryzae]|uniref:Phosphotransferase family enzyme n=1 Tax=Actinophytocola oryzae TaxID=502181 RepID=A0A4R7V2W9_9PSEU|nr:phosphotransferase [Actinophytocola oryzae]TDV43723.1 phosphotransferase family enzyme [Actinophytocola oryzae]
MLKSAASDALVLCDDAELGSITGDTVVTRQTVAEWPMSWTQKVMFSSGRTFAYKAMLPPLVESEFYAAGPSPLLPGYHHVGEFNYCANILVEWIDSPSLADLELDEAELLTHATNVVARIGEMTQDSPTYLDVGTPEKWSSEAAATLDKLRRLASDGRFASTMSMAVDVLQPWVLSTEVLDVVAAHSRLVHRDLKPAHIFPTGNGYRVIDWQVPAIAPADVDLVWLLEEAGIDSFPHVDPVTYGIAFFLHLRWATVAQHDFFPGFVTPLFEGWANDALTALARAREAVGSP